jgi:hypothetical protein
VVGVVVAGVEGDVVVVGSIDGTDVDAVAGDVDGGGDVEGTADEDSDGDAATGDATVLVRGDVVSGAVGGVATTGSVDGSSNDVAVVDGGSGPASPSAPPGSVTDGPMRSDGVVGPRALPRVYPDIDPLGRDALPVAVSRPPWSTASIGVSAARSKSFAPSNASANIASVTIATRDDHHSVFRPYIARRRVLITCLQRRDTDVVHGCDRDAASYPPIRRLNHPSFGLTMVGRVGIEPTTDGL